MTKLKKKVVVIGAGHNALTCASYLAKSGFEVEVYESRSEVGGMACTREFTEGYKVPGVAHLLHMLHPNIQKWLGLNKNGLDYYTSFYLSNDYHLFYRVIKKLVYYYNQLNVLLVYLLL